MRKLLFPIIIITSASILIIRIFYLQILNHSYKLKAENNSIKIQYVIPERGNIFDRYGKILVTNQLSYDIMVIPGEIKNIDTLELCKLLKINKGEFSKQIAKARSYSTRLPSLFLAQLDRSKFSAFQEKIRNFPGFYFQKRMLRKYTVNYGANIFGYTTQVNQELLKENSYYKSGDLIGKQGVEESYEDLLRGIKGIKYFQKDKFNRKIGSYQNGNYDTLAVKGTDMNLSIDAELQSYGEQLMVHKRGAIVAIEPQTGEILALITAPSYDPGLLTGSSRSKNYTKLYYDSISKPLYNRALLAEYPPGSPFKILTGLIGLQEGVINENTSFICRHGFSYGRGSFMKCHGEGPHQLRNGIYNSCNTYFGNTYMLSINRYSTPSKGVDSWANYLKSFGLGNYMGYDLPTGRKGKIPTSQTYNKIYPNRKWKSTTIISNSIGQGEVLMTPIQLTSMMAAVANRGYYYTPHIVRKIAGQKIPSRFTTKHITAIEKKYFNAVIDGLSDVYNFGTARGLNVPGIEICGKTGTAENFARVNGKRVQLTDHSIFAAFAPKNNPKIAIAVLIENGGAGRTIAGPIASLMIEKYLKRKISLTDLEIKVLNTSLESQYNPSLELKNKIHPKNKVSL
ncbi:penicillin-binding protein 2 [Flavobacterium aquidurense]|uniref:Penicillin-binding protein 2 n=1 Tax=Flavobacterium piscisymbiosum TaxID=2893753 RepID=A0ABS8MHQ5_9FLAO|nr:penicillin-binding protein 2 [Flavobacterium sp. F-30]MCC9065019.1 penicillin-binding protein 2 [Flavobacterium sp. F-30]